MAELDRIQKRFDQLTATADRIEKSKETITERRREEFSGWVDDERFEDVTVNKIDTLLLNEWEVSVMSLISRVFGKDSTTFEALSNCCSQPASDGHARFDRVRPVFESAKDDYEGGYLFDVANLVHSDVFADELEQAKHFLDKGFKVPAAVIAGTVLESTLRRMCETHPELSPSDSINGMNTDLYTCGVYGKAVNKQVSSWGDIRNDAAHGRPDEFDHQQINQMITGIRDFVAKHMS